MKIDSIKVDRYGPLEDINWQPGKVNVLYDDNMAGKTALIDLVIRYVFSPRKGSSTFADFERFEPGNSRVSLDLSNEGGSFKFGTDGDGRSLGKIFGWEEEELYRLMCIRSGDGSLVSREKKRTSLFDALASMVSGVEGRKLERIIEDVKRKARITDKTGEWLNRKDTRPPYLKDRIYEEILPFLDDFEEIRTHLENLKNLRGEVRDLKEKKEALSDAAKKLERRMEFLESVRLKKQLSELERLEERLNSFSRFREDLKEKWEKELEKRRKARRALLGSEESRDPGLRKRLEKVKEEREKTGKKLKEKLPAEIKNLDREVRELRKEKREIERRAEEERKKSVRFIEEKIDPRLEKIRVLEDYLKNTRKWELNGTIFYIFGSISLFSGVLMGTMLFAGLFSLSFLGGAFLAWTAYVNGKREKKKNDLKGLQGEVLDLARDRFGSYLKEELKNESSLRKKKSRLPSIVERTLKGESNFEEVRADIINQERKLEEKKEQKEKLSRELKGLDRKVEDLKKRKEEKEKDLRVAKREIGNYREKTGLAELDDLREKLERKKDLLDRLERKKELLNQGLSGSFEETVELKTEVEDRVEKLPLELKEELGEISREQMEKINVGRKLTKLERRKIDKESRIDKIESKIKEKEKNLERLERVMRQDYQLDSSNIEEIYSTKMEYTSELKEYVEERIAGYSAGRLLESIRRNFVETLESFLEKSSGEKPGPADLFSDVMGDKLELEFDHRTRKFFVGEEGRRYAEEDLSSGARRHLFYSVRLGLLNRIVPEPAFVLLDDPFLVYHKERKARAIAQLQELVESGWQVIATTVDAATRDFMVEELDAEELRMEDLKDRGSSS